jgi:nucleotide-binding universal stress UspA family protein
VNRYKKILAPTDLSELSLPAIRYALELGLEQNAEVMIYHVLSEDGDWFGKDTRLDPASALYGGKTNYCTISLPRILPISSAE